MTTSIPLRIQLDGRFTLNVVYYIILPKILQVLFAKKAFLIKYFFKLRHLSCNQSEFASENAHLTFSEAFLISVQRQL